ncbi:uncharacterized protein LOC111255058 isoform X2 [Varroa destructor]|uniref:Uncharacterized protein n=1 Tax=Varroa destructor TaxID=109461 RepID=A0A7M7KYE0_VARDE|nr:uncharacterized protein LOC111249338 isoform X2 [Varroa destructor]XP_022672421.1 uncharacterized protein LOC111255058 isoform X2 [Varroa destructor]
MAIASKIHQVSPKPTLETIPAITTCKHVEVAVLRLTTVADGVNVDIKDLLTYEVDNTSIPDKRPVNDYHVKSKYLIRRKGQKDGLEKALSLYENRRKDYVATIACLETRENKNEEEISKLRETRKFLRKLQRRIQEARKMLSAIADNNTKADDRSPKWAPPPIRTGALVLPTSDAPAFTISARI